jgi:type II secretory pathway component GspD/PulD (secretin)
VDKDKVPSNVKVDTFLQTSHTAYLKSPTDSSMIKLPTDTTGVFNLAVAIEDSSNNGKAVVFASYAIADLKSDNTVNGANSELLVSSIRWLTGQEELISVNSKFFGLSNLVYTAKEKQNVLIIVVFVIPAGILAYGLSVWVKRRRK